MQGLDKSGPFPQRTGILELLSMRDIDLGSGEVDAAQNLRLLIAYDVLYLIGFITLVAVLLVAYYTKATGRSSLWFVAVSGWAHIAFSNILLLGQQTGPQPNRHFCLMQATFIYSSPAFAAIGSAVYMIQAYCSVSRSFLLKRLSRSKSFVIFLHCITASVLVSVIVEVIVLGLADPNTIERDISGMYCHLTSPMPGHITAGISIAGMSIILIMEACIFFIIRGTTKALEDAQGGVRPPSLRISRNNFSREAFTRMTIFSSWAVVCLGLSFIVYLPQSIINNTDAQVVQATLPCVATLTFGTQRDVMNFWRCRRRNHTISELKFDDGPTQGDKSTQC